MTAEEERKKEDFCFWVDCIRLCLRCVEAIWDNGSLQLFPRMKEQGRVSRIKVASLSFIMH